MQNYNSIQFFPNYEFAIQLKERVESFKKEGFLYGISHHHYTDEKIIRKTEEIEHWIKRMREFHNDLIAYKETFLGDWAPEDNKCYDNVLQHFKSIQKNMPTFRAWYLETCPPIKRHRTDVMGNQIYRNPYQHASWGKNPEDLGIIVLEDSCSQATKIFVDKIQEAVDQLVAIIEECLATVAEVENYRKRFELSSPAYENELNNLLYRCKSIYSRMEKYMKDDDPDDITLCELQAKSFEEFVCQCYHVFDKAQMLLHAFYKRTHDGKLYGLDPLASAYWAGNLEKGKEAIVVIRHFDELGVKGRNNNKTGKIKIDRAKFCMFYVWCEGKKGPSDFLSIFEANYEGEYEILSNPSLTHPERQFNDSDYKYFKKRVQELLNKHYKIENNTFNIN